MSISKSVLDVNLKLLFCAQSIHCDNGVLGLDAGDRHALYSAMSKHFMRKYRAGLAEAKKAMDTADKNQLDIVDDLIDAQVVDVLDEKPVKTKRK